MNAPTLIHLVSDQTMQNVLPILALRPGRIVQVVSDAGTARFGDAARNIRQAVDLACRTIPEFHGWRPDWNEPVSLESPAPTIEGSRVRIAGLLRDHKGAVVNYTGGTKNMSIAAWSAAKEHGAPTLYCDTPRSFVSGGTGDLTGVPELSGVARCLRTPVLLAAQGLLQGKHWNRRGIDPNIAALGAISFDLGRRSGKTFRDFRHGLFLHGCSANGRPDKATVERALKQPVPPHRSEFTPFLAAARDAGLLVEKDGNWYYNVSSGKPYKAVFKKVGTIAQALTGAAFEAHIAGLLKVSPKFTDFLSNVYPAGSAPEEHGFGESDFLAYEPGAVALTLISCKSSPPRLEHLESLLARKAKFGGLFARTLLCVENEGDPSRGRLLKSQCQSLGIGCAIADAIDDALAVR